MSYKAAFTEWLDLLIITDTDPQHRNNWMIPNITAIACFFFTLFCRAVLGLQQNWAENTEFPDTGCPWHIHNPNPTIKILYSDDTFGTIDEPTSLLPQIQRATCLYLLDPTVIVPMKSLFTQGSLCWFLSFITESIVTNTPSPDILPEYFFLPLYTVDSIFFLTTPGYSFINSHYLALDSTIIFPLHPLKGKELALFIFAFSTALLMVCFWVFAKSCPTLFCPHGL